MKVELDLAAGWLGGARGRGGERGCIGVTWGIGALVAAFRGQDRGLRGGRPG